MKKLQDTDNCENWLIPNIDFFESRLKASGITDDEIDHLKNLISQSSKPIINWIDNKKYEIKKNIKPFSNFIKRGY